MIDDPDYADQVLAPRQPLRPQNARDEPSNDDPLNQYEEPRAKQSEISRVNQNVQGTRPPIPQNEDSDEDLTGWND